MVSGVETESGKIINCGSLIVTSGTFLSGKIFYGKKKNGMPVVWETHLQRSWQNFSGDMNLILIGLKQALHLE